MPRTAVPVITPPLQYPALPITPATLDFVGTAADTVNFNQAPMTGRELLLVQNSTGGALTVTITSVADLQKRTGDITAYSLAAAKFAVFGPFPTPGWQQPDGNLYFQGSAAGILFFWIRLPSIA